MISLPYACQSKLLSTSRHLVIEDSACTGDVSCSYDIDDDDGEIVISPSDIVIGNGGCNGTAACAGNIGNVSSLAW